MASNATDLVELLATTGTWVWPPHPAHSYDDTSMNAPRMAACRALIEAASEEQRAVILMLLGLGAFVGPNQDGEPEPLMPRLRWHRARETVLHHMPTVRSRHLRHRAAGGQTREDSRESELYRRWTQIVVEHCIHRLAQMDSQPVPGAAGTDEIIHQTLTDLFARTPQRELTVKLLAYEP